MFELISNKSFLFVLFFALGLFMGRISALLTELFSATMPAYPTPADSPDTKTNPTNTKPAKDPDTKASPAPDKMAHKTPIPSGEQASSGRAYSSPADFSSLVQPPPLNAPLKNGLKAFVLDYQNKWGHLPCSYLFNKHYRKQDGSLRAFILELLMGTLFVLLIHHVGWKYLLLEYLLFTFAVVTASAVDWEHMILPDTLTLSGIGIGLVGAWLNPEVGRAFWPALGGMLMGGGFLWLIAILYYYLKKEEGLGGGDIKLLAWIGTVLTWKAIPFVILLSCLTGLLAGIFMMFRSENYLKQSIPFGPYLAFSALVYIFWGQNLARLYLSWFFYP